jgi:hypothetical protein
MKKMLLAVCLAAVTLLVSACDFPDILSFTPAPTTAIPAPIKTTIAQSLPYTHGRIDTAQPVSLVSQTVPTSGASVKFNSPGNPLDGLTIQVPSGAYPDNCQFKVSASAVNNVTFPNLKPITPLITVDNGGEYADQLMLVTIPIKVPVGEFAMGFFYDDQLGKVEGIPSISQSSGWLTLATRHFSKFLVASIGETALDVDILTNFMPGIDNWQFKNKSVAFVDGICAGMSVSSMWYYYNQPDGSNVHLWGKYNGLGGVKTTDFDDDDALAIRAAGMVQMYYENDKGPYQQFFRLWINISPEVTRKLFAFSMLVSGGPQLAEWSNATQGHSMVAVGVMNGNIILVDPNYPSEIKSTQIKDGSMIYDGHPVVYMAASALVNENLVAGVWKQVADGGVGKAYFPPYNLMVSTYDNTKKTWGTAAPLTDGLTVTSGNIKVSIEKTNWTAPWSLGKTGFNLTFYDPDIITISGSRCFHNGSQITLMPGANKIGILVTVKVDNGRFGNVKDGWSDFRWLTLQNKAQTADISIMDKLWKTKYFALVAGGGTHTSEVLTASGRTLQQSTEYLEIPRPVQIGWPDILEISWNGTHFTGKGEYKDANTTYSGVLTGLFSADASQITNINFSDTYRSGDSSNYVLRKTELSIASVPVKDNPDLIFSLSNDDMSLLLNIFYSDVEETYKDGKQVQKVNYLFTDWSKDAAVQVGFSTTQ